MPQASQVYKTDSKAIKIFRILKQQSIESDQTNQNQINLNFLIVGHFS